MDRKPPCEPEHSPVGGDGPTLGEVLGVNKASPSPAAAQRQMEEAIYAVVSPATGDETCLVFFDNTEEQIAELLRVCTGRLLGNEARWVRFYKKNLGRGAAFVLQNHTPDGESELIVVAPHKYVLTAHVLREVSWWAFKMLCRNRIVVRIPCDRPELSEMARKAGFHHEGTARRYFDGSVNAHVWAMCAADCRWLPKDPPLIPPDVSPRSSMELH